MARRIRWQIVIAVVASLVVLVLLSTAALSNTAVSRPLAGGTYVEATTGTPRDVIPLLNTPLADPVGRDIAALLFDGLTRIGIGNLPEPALAESWEIDEEGEIYTFRLRRDVQWHDGQPFTAADVLFTIQTIQSPDFPGDPALAGLWRSVLVDQVDSYTIRCTLNAPYAPFLSMASIPILPAHLLADMDIGEWANSPFASQPVGTGPYEIVELNTMHALLHANDGYFGGTPFIESFELRFVESSQAALSALTRQEIQAMGVKTSPELSQVTLPTHLRRFNIPLDEYALLSFNLREPLLENTELRQALARGLDKDMLIERALPGIATRLDTPVLTGWWAYDPHAQWYEYDPEIANQLLDNLGYVLNGQGIRARGSERLAFPLITDADPNRLAVAEEIARQWADIGVLVEVEQLDSAELRQRLQSHDFLLAVHGWARLGADPDMLELWHSSQAVGGTNYAGLNDTVIDRSLINARTELDLVQRGIYYADFQQRWIELVPGIVLYQPLYTFVASDDLGGLEFGKEGSASNLLLIGQEDRYRNVSGWFVRSSREIRGTLR